MSHILRMPGIPDRSRALLQRLLAEDLIPVEALPHLVESYREVIHDAARSGGRANAVLGDRIADALLAMLSLVNDQTGTANLRVIQAGVRYFVIENDGMGSDLDSSEGLYDDARVLNAILRFFGLDHFMIGGVPETRDVQRPVKQQRRRR